MKKLLLVVSCICLLLIGAWVITDVANNTKINPLPALPTDGKEGDATKVLWFLENGARPDFNALLLECDYIDARYDKADFSIQTLLRLMYGYNKAIPEDVQTRIKETLLGFKYWMDQPGEDSMCYWSENHQILFATSEYLAGQLYPQEVFVNDQQTGIDHQAMGKERVLIWLEQRWLYGFTEWYSNTYYKEDVLALSNLIDFAEDEEVVVKAQMVMDLLWYDVASQSYKGTFVTTSGRLYEDNKKSGHGNRLSRISQELFGFDLELEEKKSGLDLNFIYMKNYELPKVIKAIALDTEEVIIKASNGLDITELKGENLIGQADAQIMMQWGMEAFTNPEVIENSLNYIGANHMFSNEFLYDFRLMNIGLLQKTSLLPLLSDGLNFKSNGIAIQRANTYTYKTMNYMLATAQSYHPGTFGDQQHVWTATLSNDVSIFTTHPAKPISDSGALSGSPNYWVGSGRLPHSVQDKNINLSIYKIPNKKGFMEESLVDYTHAYFPKELMDEVVLQGRYIFGRLGKSYIAMIGMKDLAYVDDSTEDLIQEGKTTYWVTELSSGDQESFQGFMKRIDSNDLTYSEQSNQLTYTSNEQVLELTYGQGLKINDLPLDTAYSRMASTYSEVERKPDIIVLEHQEASLYLDFYNGRRLVSD